VQCSAVRKKRREIDKSSIQSYSHLMATQPHEAHSKSAPALPKKKEETPKGVIAGRCGRFVGSEGIEKFRKLLPQLIQHAAQGDAAPAMQYVLQTRTSLSQLATSLHIHNDALDAERKKQQPWLQGEIGAALRAHPERNGNGTVHRLIQIFAKRFETCAALAAMCIGALRPQVEDEIAGYLDAKENEGEEQESPTQRALRQTEQKAHGKEEPKPPAAVGQNPPLGDSGSEPAPAPTPVPQADTDTPPDGPIPLAEAE
jgi:hypothetical protein